MKFNFRKNNKTKKKIQFEKDMKKLSHYMQINNLKNQLIYELLMKIIKNKITNNNNCFNLHLI